MIRCLIEGSISSDSVCHGVIFETIILFFMVLFVMRIVEGNGSDKTYISREVGVCDISRMRLELLARFVIVWFKKLLTTVC